MIAYQKERDFPGTLVQTALADRVTKSPQASEETVTWDSLDQLHGPFANALMWLSVDGAELPALLGAEALFRRGAVQAVNVENRYGQRDVTKQIDAYLRKYRLPLMTVWNRKRGLKEDRFYLRSKL
jgi:hypothetical protein